ncbi:MAG: discoidin domain-containing protein [Acidobacteria bacterium]|nr:discoidin domain-containing protein [Acidobacteriota bacterium]
MSKRQELRRTKQAGVLLAAAFVGAAGLSLFAQAPGNPQPPAPTPPAQGARGGGAAPGGPGRGAGPGNLGANWTETAPIQPKRPEEQAKTFLLPTGYRMELVASDPDIIMPTAMEWDGNGRMFVVEMRTYMLDADGKDKYKPISRISMWEDTNADGTYDKHSMFVDNLVLPRMVLPLDGNSILTNETETHDVVKWTDTNNDGVADKRELWYSGVGRPGSNLEHQQSGFVWGMDNWIYSTYNAFRFRWTPTGIIREATGANGGQWGLTQDADGKMWFVDAGGERGPMNFQVPIHYGSFTVPDQFEPGFDVVWPAPGIGDMQGGMARIRMPLANLNHFTATTGPEIVHGHRMPADIQGDLLFTEPVGRLVRQAKIVKDQGLTQLRNAYPGSEFLLGTDPLFRPVNIKTGPDGTIYIADMYQGIIQESQWTPRGSYLRAKIEQYQLDKINQYGRIWRLRYDGYPAGGPNTPASPAIAPDYTRPRMLEETPAQLITHFTHPNAWWRNSAQRLLVLKQDKSVVPALQTMARTSDNLYARFHALWSLEGLGALDAGLVRETLKDPNPRMRIQAMRASETLYKAGDRSLEVDYRNALKDTDADMVIQAMLTLNVLKVPGAITEIRPIVQASTFKGVKEIGGQLIQRAEAAVGRAGAGLAPAAAASIERGETVYNELCFSCHGEDGRGARLDGAPVGVTRAPSLEGNERVVGHRDHVIKVLLHGLTGPIAGQTYTEVMIPMGQNTDQWIADVASFVRNSWGNSAAVITADEVARVRAATANRSSMWTAAELAAAVPTLVAAQPEWTVTAGHNTETAARGVAPAAAGGGFGQGQAWTSGVPQTAGMFLQIAMDAPVQLTEVQIDTPVPGFGRGGRGGGRGGAPGAPAPAPPAPGFARGYQLQVSMDGSRWTTVAAGEGSAGTTVVQLKQPTRARFVRINQTATTPDAPAWSIQRVRLYQVPAR